MLSWRFILSINKLSKYGIVLVAAVTLATAVQTQFGQSSTKVYAEEIANDPSLNRMLYINVSSPDDPTLGWLTGEVVTPKGYIVESAGEVEGFPYFTITGSNGKNYSVGDVITTEEPGLFGHANMEDDALYYRYYRTNPNSVSEAPAVSTTPATSEAPAVSTTPATSEAPANSTTPATSENPISDNDPSLDRMLYLDYALSDDPKISWLTGNVVTPKGYIVQPADEVEGYPYYTITGSNGKKYSVGDVITTEEPGLFGHANYEDDALYYRYYRTNPNSVSEAPAVSETPATSEAPAVSTTPATSEAPAVSTTPATSEAPAVSTTPATSEAPAVSTTPATSEAPAVSTTPATSEAPAVSTTPATSEAPAVSTTPATSEAPAASTAPATSETPAVNTTPTTSEAPAVSTTPATGLVPSKNIHSMNSVTSPFTQTRNAGIKSEADGKLTSHDLPKTGDTNSKVGMLGMVLVGLGLTSFVYKGRHRRS